jgi:serine/threonine protein kinase
LRGCPVPPVEVNPAVPDALSDIILRLLEKEPDDRYRTAEGVAHDLERCGAGPIPPRLRSASVNESAGHEGAVP